MTGRRNLLLWFAATCLWAGWLLYMTLTPDKTPNTDNLVPFLDHARALRCVLSVCPQHAVSLRYLLIDFLGNVVVFIPLGAGLAGLLSFSPRRRRHRLTLAALGGVLFSLTIEFIQHTIPTRAADLTDLLLNGLGTAMGAALWLIKIGDK